jgi:ubiquitin C-terminal hydrolase
MGLVGVNMTKRRNMFLKKLSSTKTSKKSKAELNRIRMQEWKEFLKDDAEYDWSFILKVLAYKLKRTRQCLNCTEDAPVSKKEIKTVEDLIVKVYEEDGCPSEKELKTNLAKAFDLMTKQIWGWWD